MAANQEKGQQGRLLAPTRSLPAFSIQLPAFSIQHGKRWQLNNPLILVLAGVGLRSDFTSNNPAAIHSPLVTLHRSTFALRLCHLCQFVVFVSLVSHVTHVT